MHPATRGVGIVPRAIFRVIFGQKGLFSEAGYPFQVTAKPAYRGARRVRRPARPFAVVAAPSREPQWAGLAQRAHLVAVVLLVSLGAVTCATTPAFGLSPSSPPWSRTATTSAASVGKPAATAAARATGCTKSYRQRFTRHPDYVSAATVRMSTAPAASHDGVTVAETFAAQDVRGGGASTAATASFGGSVEAPIHRLDIVGSTTPGSSTGVSAAAIGEDKYGSIDSGGATGAASTAAVTMKPAAAVDALLPGTWCSAGLPKWVHVVRRRMLTKEDWLHLHAASGLVYQVGGALWLLNVMGLEIFRGVPQLDVHTPVPLFILGAGLVNSLSSIPMANTRSWVLNGVCASVMQLWFAWYVSGAYPASLAPADPWLATAGFTILVIAYVEAEETIAKESRARELTRQSTELQRKASGKILMRKDDYVEGDAVNRYGALATLLLNTPHLFATLVDSGWVGRLAEAYPAGPALLFHAHFALATSTSITLLAPTLYVRRLIDAKTFAMMQFISLAPLVTSVVDANVMGSAATNNPLELYLGFIH